MKRSQQSILFASMAVVLLTVRPGWTQDVFELDNKHTATIFAVSHFNIGYIYGRFNTCSGTVSLDKDNPSSSKFKFAIDANSIDTNDAERDEHLKGEEFFDAEKFPNIEFESTSVSVIRGTYNVTGNMAIRGQKKEMIMPLQLLGVGNGPFGNLRLGMIGKFTIKRTDFGMDKMLEGLGNDIAITFSFEAIQKK